MSIEMFADCLVGRAHDPFMIARPSETIVSRSMIDQHPARSRRPTCAGCNTADSALAHYEAPRSGHCFIRDLVARRDPRRCLHSYAQLRTRGRA
jgi:hypothetical protein